MGSRAERGQSKSDRTLDLTIEVTTWVTKQVGGDGSGTRMFEEPVLAGDTVRTALRRFSRRFPELDAALWNPDHTDLGEPIEVAHAVLSWLREEASYITGHTLAVSGGR